MHDQDTAPLQGMTRAQHLAWAKERALAYVDTGDLTAAFTSLSSDLTKHPELGAASTIQNELGLMQLMAGQLESPKQMREWIEGFA
jgi:hypothetical protein